MSYLDAVQAAAFLRFRSASGVGNAVMRGGLAPVGRGRSSACFHDPSDEGVVTIDDSGKWWVGSEPQDLEAYLKALCEEGYGVQAFRLARCTCGSERFKVKADRDEGAAQWTCVACSAQNLVCDSADAWDDAKPKAWSCVECRSKEANVGCGFALLDSGEVRWIYLGLRCAKCGILGCFADWKIDYEPSTHLLEQV